MKFFSNITKISKKNIKKKFILKKNTNRDKTILSEFLRASISARLISFDLFDTLLLRSFWEPADVFDAVAVKYMELAPEFATWFPANRKRAEGIAHSNARMRGADDATLSEIYAELGNLMLENHFQHIKIQDLMKDEIKIEFDCIFADQRVLNVFNYIKSLNKEIVIVSDMYLPQYEIEKILKKNSIFGYKKLYVSSTVGFNKSSGRIWDLVRSDFDIKDKEKIIHLGDNPYSDGKVADQRGVKAYLLSQARERLPWHAYKPSGDWLTDICHGLLRKSLSLNPGRSAYWSTLGYLLVAPAAIGMAGFVKKRAKELNLEDRIYFLARDGLIFQKAYELAWRSNDRQPSKYVWASRRCLNLPIIGEELTTADLRFLCQGGRAMPAIEYIRRIDLDENDPEIRAAFCSIFQSESELISPNQDRHRLHLFFRKIQKKIYESAKRERELLFRYLNELDFFSKDSIVVDVGWHGSLQRSLIKFSNMSGFSNDILGIYFGTVFNDAEEIDGLVLKSDGWIFKGSRPTEIYEETFLISCEVIELLLSAPESGIKSIDEKCSKLLPRRLSDHESEMPRLEVSALFHDIVEEVSAHIKPFLTEHSVISFHHMAIENLRSLLMHPNKIDAEHFSKIPHAEGFGLAEYNPIIYQTIRTFNPKILTNAYWTSYWRRGFLASLEPIERGIATISISAGKILGDLRGANRRIRR
jgi:predicted HAD superfamily hydrolase